MKRLRLIIVLALVLVFGSLAVIIYRAREPRYQGRTLSEWIKQGVSAKVNFGIEGSSTNGNLETDPSWQAASHAVKQMAP